MQKKKRRILPRSESVLYGLDIAVPTAITGAIGYGIHEILPVLGRGLDYLHTTVLPAAAKADATVGTQIVEKGGPVGETAISIDQKVGQLWSRIIHGQDYEQKQATWRAQHNIEQPSYLPPTEKTTAVLEQPVQPLPSYEKQFSHYGNISLLVGLVGGALYGALRGLPRFLQGRKYRQVIETSKALSERVDQLERTRDTQSTTGGAK